jgi:hypothetical protein
LLAYILEPVLEQALALALVLQQLVLVQLELRVPAELLLQALELVRQNGRYRLS